MEAGQLADACAPFAEIQRLSTAVGTLLNLADCEEKLSQTASAWAEFRSAAGQSEREGIARDRAAACGGSGAHPTPARAARHAACNRWRELPLRRGSAPVCLRPTTSPKVTDRAARGQYGSSNTISCPWSGSQTNAWPRSSATAQCEPSCPSPSPRSVSSPESDTPMNETVPSLLLGT